MIVVRLSAFSIIFASVMLEPSYTFQSLAQYACEFSGDVDRNFSEQFASGDGLNERNDLVYHDAWMVSWSVRASSYLSGRFALD